MSTPAVVRKAVIPAAGLGTRFLPQTKAMPKEMLPIVDRPVIQIIVEDLVAAGVTDIIIVTGPQKRAIEDHFDRAYELESALKRKDKNEQAEEIRRIAEMANFVYVRQKGEMTGNAIPLMNAAHLLDNEPFFYFFADDFFNAERSQAQQLLDVYNRTGKSVMTLQEVNPEESTKYGMVAIDGEVVDQTARITEVIEKPDPKDSPSNFASVGGYLLTPEVMPYVRSQEVSKRGEVELPEAVNRMAQDEEVYGCFVEGKRHDAGNKLSYVQAVVDVALDDPKLQKPLKEFLSTRLDECDS